MVTNLNRHLQKCFKISETGRVQISLQNSMKYLRIGTADGEGTACGAICGLLAKRRGAIGPCSAAAHGGRGHCSGRQLGYLPERSGRANSSWIMLTHNFRGWMQYFFPSRSLQIGKIVTIHYTTTSIPKITQRPSPEFCPRFAWLLTDPVLQWQKAHAVQNTNSVVRWVHSGAKKHWSGTQPFCDVHSNFAVNFGEDCMERQ